MLCTGLVVYMVLYLFGWVHGAVPVWLGTWYCTDLVGYMMLYQFGWVHGAGYYRSWSFRSAVLFAILLYVTENETINESRLFRILHLAQVHLAPICTQYIVSNFTVYFLHNAAYPCASQETNTSLFMSVVRCTIQWIVFYNHCSRCSISPFTYKNLH